MKKNEKSIAKEGNLKNNYQPFKGYVAIGNCIVNDNRLDYSEFYLLCKLLSLKNFHVSNHNSCRFFRMSEATFGKHLNRLVELGYIERSKKGKGYAYIIKTPREIEGMIFDYRKMRDGEYTRIELEAFYKDKYLDPRWKPILKRYLVQTNKAVKQMREDTEKEVEKDPNLPF